MSGKPKEEPDCTAVRVALWRALHVEIDPLRNIFEDEIGIKLAAPDERRRSRPGARSRGPSALRSWLVLDLSKILLRSKRLVAPGSTSSSEQAWTPLPSAGRSSFPACWYSRLIGQVLRREHLQRPETIEFIRLYYAIPDPKVRRQFLDMAKTVAESFEPKTS